MVHVEVHKTGPITQDNTLFTLKLLKVMEYTKKDIYLTSF